MGRKVVRQTTVNITDSFGETNRLKEYREYLIKKIRSKPTNQPHPKLSKLSLAMGVVFTGEVHDEH